MANTVKSFMHRIGRFLSAPFMGNVWMARCKSMAKDCNHLIELNSEYGQRFTELRAASERKISQLQSKYDKRKADLDALHGYALDLDAQCSDAIRLFSVMNNSRAEWSAATQTGICIVVDIIKSLPCYSRISMKDRERLFDAFRTIPTDFKPITLKSIASAAVDPRPAEPTAQV